jgi:LuxR family transcriptional regulator, maltose regulon positive regulatory protein
VRKAWGTGLRLLTLALQGLQGQPQIEKFLGTFAGSHHSIRDYFATEVLNVLPDKMQVFILQTSVLERLTPEPLGSPDRRTGRRKRKGA